MKATLDRLNTKRRLVRSRLEESQFPGDWKRHLARATPIDEAELRRLEQEHEVSLPAEYRAFLRRFGDGHFGPGARFHRVVEGLSPAATCQFPLGAPLLGRCSPARHSLPSEAAKWEDFSRLVAIWKPIPKDHGVLSIADYGSAMKAVLILNGPFAGRVWMLSGDAAYYGPFGGSEPLHDSRANAKWAPTGTPREYSFFAWYESWLDGQR